MRMKKMIENPQTSIPNQNSGKMEVVISTTTYDSEDLTEYVYLLKDDFDQFYLLRTVCGWKQVSDIQKNWDILSRYKYYVDKAVVPLIYYILATNPQQLEKVFEFFYRENFIEYEEEKDSI